MMQAGTVHRVARPTAHLTTIAAMYATGLDFTVLAEFHDHEGFDGIILGHPHSPYHLEFTTQRGHQVGKAPTQDHLLVFYLPTGTSGKPVVPGCWQRGFDVSHHITRIGKPRGRRLRISMGIGLCSRTRRGPCKESDGKTWHCSR